MSDYKKAIAEARSLYESSSDEVRAVIDQIFPHIFGENYKPMPEKIPLEAIIKMLVKKEKKLNVEIGKLKAYIEELEARLPDEKVLEALQKENKTLRKDCKKSEWYSEVKRVIDEKNRKCKEWMEAASRANVKLMEYEKKFGKI